MTTFTREEIYQMVWNMPIIEIAQKYIISDVGFRKLCIRLDVPLPKRGYWNKVKVGQKVKQLLLPESTKRYSSVQLEERPPEHPVKKVSELDLLTKKMALEKLPFKVPERLTKPEPIITAARESLTKLTDTNYPGMAVTGRGQLDIRVSPRNVGRALRFMDTLIKCICARGYLLELAKDGTYVVIRSTKLKISFRERTTKFHVSDKPYREFEWRPNGRLVFRIDCRSRSEWQDLKVKLLEEQLPRILAKLELAAKQEELYMEKARLWQENWERERKAKAEFEARQRSEIKAFKELVKNARHWKQADLLREYLNSMPSPDPQWLAWANAKANWLDPNNATDDAWLREIDKEGI